MGITSAPGLIEDSMDLERTGDIAAALVQVREVLDLVRAEGDPEEIALALAPLQTPAQAGLQQL